MHRWNEETEEPGREQLLGLIRRTYAEYERSGRYRLWTTRNRGFARIARDRHRAFAQLLRNCLPREARTKVLDLGCGRGDSAELAIEMRREIEWSGVDLLPELLDTARSMFPWAQFVEASADQLPFPAASYDVVIASTLFSSLPSPEFEEAVAAEIGRVLRPEGSLLWYDLRRDNPRNSAVHGVSRERIRQLFPGWRSELKTTTLIPPLARSLGLTVPVLYPALEALPPLRSHLIGRLERPRVVDS